MMNKQQKKHQKQEWKYQNNGGIYLKINKIKINSYGKLKNTEIKLKNNLNIIYGKNESGK